MPDTILVLIAIVVSALVSRRLWPYARCRSCRGSGLSGGSNRHRWGICRRCGGSGKRTRLGARRD
jgi:DnaJ-class molecular chaperone